MTHSMQLTPSPFQMIKEGTKTIRLRYLLAIIKSNFRWNAYGSFQKSNT